MKKTTKKLAFSSVTVRTLQQSMSEEQLQGVAGGTVVMQPPNVPGPNPTGGMMAGPRTGITVSRITCTSMPTTMGAC